MTAECSELRQRLLLGVQSIGAQHCTAQHGTAQHAMARHSLVEHLRFATAAEWGAK